MNLPIETRVFEYLVGQAAFIDKIEVSFAETDSAKPQEILRRRLIRVKSLPIGGGKSLYGRLLLGKSKNSGNRVSLKYSRQTPLKRVPFARLIARSEKVPLTAAQMLLLTKRLRLQHVGLVEMTFDVRGISPRSLAQQLFTRARITRFMSTVYVGSRMSPWQARVYRKRDNITRFEFVFRRAFLRKHRINKLSDIAKLRRLNLGKLVCLRELSESALEKVLHAAPSLNSSLATRHRDILRLARTHPHQTAAILRNEYGIGADRVFVPSKTQRLLKSMQRQFLW